MAFKKQFLFLGVIALFLVSPGFAQEKILFPAPTLLAGTTKEMKSPGFWITLHPSPNQIILEPEAIRAFNQQLAKNGLIKDLLNMDSFDLHVCKTQIQKEIQKFEHGNYYDQEGKIISRDFFKQLKDNLTLDDIDDVVPRYAFIVHQSDQRLLPSAQILTAEPLDLEFDEVQNSSLDAGEPAVVFYETLDEQWVYTQTRSSTGWVRKENLVFVSSDEFKNHLSLEHFAVVTTAKADLFLDSQRTKYYDTARMGAKFVIVQSTEAVLEVLTAPGKSVFINRKDVNEGFLPYTPRTIIEQAFKMLNAPYGWGGANGEQDCSAFLKGIFAVVGISLPRNSAEQGKSGTLIKTLDEALPGITLVQMKGHIVLYLGQYQKQPFAIHEAYAYREPTGDGGIDRVRVMNRVVVSDLHLGAGSQKGSLFKRIVAIREIR